MYLEQNYALKFFCVNINALLLKASLRVAIKGRSHPNNNIICSAICMAIKVHSNQWCSKLHIVTLRSLLVTNVILLEDIIYFINFNTIRYGPISLVIQYKMIIQQD